MKLYYKTREAARSSLKAHKLVDAGAEAPKGKRYARELKPVVKSARVFELDRVSGKLLVNMPMLEAA